MTSKSKKTLSDDNQQSIFDFDFGKVVESAEVFSKEQVAGQVSQFDAEYSPIAQTAEYVQRTVQFERAWETTIQKAREHLLTIDPRDLYFDFFTDLKYQIEQNDAKSPKLASLLDHVAYRCFGMGKQQVRISKPSRGGVKWQVQIDATSMREHLKEHIFGEYFLNEVNIENSDWKNKKLIIGASDVSQHRSAVPVPARFFRRSVPFVLNNAAGTLFSLQDNAPKYDNIFNPKPDETLLRWMLIDPSYQDELEPEDYQRCLMSAMDVGHYKFDHEYLLKTDRSTPDIIFRDGSLFPQDAYLDNFIVENRRGEFTREAIREMLSCLAYAKEIGIAYCGVVKNVQLKVYSAVVDWFIAKHIDASWEFGNYTLNDVQAMSLLLSSPNFVSNNLNQVIATCLVKRSFTTRARLNFNSNLDDLDSYFDEYRKNLDRKEITVDITPYQRLCDIAKTYMFYIGHSKNPQQQLPRYEFFYPGDPESVKTMTQKVLSAVQRCGLRIDRDHSFMADEPINYLLPSVTQQAHDLSKDVGKHVDRETGQWIMARYKSALSKMR